MGRSCLAAEIIEAAKPYVPGIGYEPQTKAGELGQTFGEMLPGAVVPGQLMMRGAGGAARLGRAAVDTLYQAAAPAVAAETAEAAAKDTRFAPYAAPAAAIATSLATGQLPVPRGAAAVPGVSPAQSSASTAPSPTMPATPRSPASSISSGRPAG